jgi:hypothetical protein
MNSDGVGDPLVVANVASGQSHGVSQSIEAKMKRAANKTEARKSAMAHGTRQPLAWPGARANEQSMGVMVRADTSDSMTATPTVTPN